MCHLSVTHTNFRDKVKLVVTIVLIIPLLTNRSRYYAYIYRTTVRMWRKVNFVAEYSWLEIRVFLLLNWLPNSVYIKCVQGGFIETGTEIMYKTLSFLRNSLNGLQPSEFSIGRSTSKFFLNVKLRRRYSFFLNCDLQNMGKYHMMGFFLLKLALTYLDILTSYLYYIDCSNKHVFILRLD